MPTATDMALINGVPLQAVIATTPTPTLYWDDNNGNKASVNILSYNLFPSTSTVYLDDIAITYNPYGDIFAYVTCRVLLPSNITEIHLITFQWSSLTNGFQRKILPTYQDTRSTTADAFDAVMIDVTASDLASWQAYNGSLAFTYSKSGDTYVSYGTVNFVDGSLNSTTNAQLFMTGSVKPDIVMHFELNGAIWNNFYVAALNGNQVDYKSKLGQTGTTYLSSNTLRSVSIDDATNGFVVAINELNNVNKKSFIRLQHNDLQTTTPVSFINVNKDIEDNCSNNTNYKFTGFPKVKSYFFNPHYYYNFEVVWQQVICNGTDFCNLQAISKRFNKSANNPNIAPYNNNQYINISSDLSKNNCFPSINYKRTYGLPIGSLNTRFVCYSFDMMNKTSNSNGLVGYKKNTAHNYTYSSNPPTNDDVLRVANKNETESEVGIELKNFKNLTIYPNPANDYLQLQSKVAVLKIEVYTISGVLQKSIKYKGFTNLTIAVSDLVNGQYLVKIYTNDNKVDVKKFSIIH